MKSKGSDWVLRSSFGEPDGGRVAGVGLADDGARLDLERVHARIGLLQLLPQESECRRVGATMERWTNLPG